MTMDLWVTLFAGILGGALRVGVPFLFVSLGECLTEKSGRINLGLEGQELHRLSDLDDDRSAPYFSAVLAPAHRGETGGRL